MITFPRFFRPMVVVTFAGQQASNIAGVGPHISFRVVKSLTSTPDTAEIAIYGLAPARKSAIAATFAEVGFAPLTIAVGYEGVPGALFLGDIRKMDVATFARAGVPLTATADDTGDALASATINISTLGFTVQNMIDAAILAFAQPILNPSTGKMLSPGTTVVPHSSVAAMIGSAQPAAVTTVYTAVHVGNATDLLDEAARLLQCRWWIRDRQLYMARAGLPIDGLAVLLPRTHWLDEPTEEGAGIVRVSTFLDPNLLPGRQVTLSGRRTPYKGVRSAEQLLIARDVVGDLEPFRIEHAEYVVDTHGGTPMRATLTLQRIGGV